MDAYEPNQAFSTRKSQSPSFSDKNNGKIAGSRYKSPTPRRFLSPSTARTVTPSAPVQKRAVSTGRRPPASPTSPTTPVHDTICIDLAARKAGGNNKLPESLWPSRMRSLNVAFQSNTFSMPVIKKEKPPPQAVYDRTLKPSSNVSSPTYRKSTPERKRSPLKGKTLTDQSENSKPLDGLHTQRIDRHRWPSRTTANSNILNKSVDLSNESIKKTITPSLRKASLEKNGGLLTPSSPNKSSNTRGPSPSRTRIMSSGPSSGVSPMRSSSPSKHLCNSNTVSVLTFVADIKRGKNVATRIEDAHHLRLLYNRQVQWQFVNAGAEAVLNSQKVTAEKSLISAQKTISQFQDSVAAKRINICQLKMQLKLYLALNQHIAYLNQWCSIERDHSFALLGCIKDLQASTLRLPVTGYATANIKSVKSAVYSAIKLMQTMGSSLQSTLSRLERTNWLVYDLATVAAQERALLDQCRALMASASSLQVFISFIALIIIFI
ncbi:AUGMIN subunit 8-like [Bidens hawaiensis]|uniref:AUGMIN subunit 8-like n=1 Tax=Bidens hawaiensis TaxID=980011 RepID=UPI00404B318A